MMIFSVVPPSYAGGPIVIEDSIDVLGDIHPVVVGVKDVDGLSILTITLDCGNTSDASNNLDPFLRVHDPNGDLTSNDDGLAGSDCAGAEPWLGSQVVLSGSSLTEGFYTIEPTSFCEDSGSVTFGCPGTGVGPYTLTITLTGEGQISTSAGAAPPRDPPNDAPKGKMEFIITPDHPCDALQPFSGG